MKIEYIKKAENSYLIEMDGIFEEEVKFSEIINTVKQLAGNDELEIELHRKYTSSKFKDFKMEIRSHHIVYKDVFRYDENKTSIMYKSFGLRSGYFINGGVSQASSYIS